MKPQIRKNGNFKGGTKILSNESSVESSSNREEDGEKLASVNVGEAGDTQESDNDTENDWKKKVVVLKRPLLTRKLPVNIL